MVGTRFLDGVVICSFITLAIVSANQDLEHKFSREDHESFHFNDTAHTSTGHGDKLSHIRSDTAPNQEGVIAGNTSKGKRTHRKKPESSSPTQELMNHTTNHHVVEPVTPINKYHRTTKPEVTRVPVHNSTATTENPRKERLMLARYRNMMKYLPAKLHHSVKLYNAHHHLRRRGHLYFFNQFVYELKTLRSCFYQFVKKGCTLLVFYQSLDTEPLTVYISDQHGMVLHDNNLQKSGNFSLTTKESDIYEVCLENFSWDVKKVFLSIRVESATNSKVMMLTHHPAAHTLLGRLRNLEVEVRSMQAHLWNRKARGSCNKIAEMEKIDFAVWITWLLVFSTLLVYTLQVIEIHRVVRSAEVRYSGGAEYVRIALRDPNI